MHSSKKAIAATVSLLLCISALYFIAVSPYFYGAQYYYQDGFDRKNLAGTIDTVISGDSHGYRGINTEKLNEYLGINGYNLSCVMATMQCRYYMLKKELARNPVKTVIFDVAFYTLTDDRAEIGPEGDVYTLGRLLSPFERLSYFLRFVKPHEYAGVFHDTMERSKKSLTMLRQNSPQYKPIKGFYPLAPNDVTVSSDDVTALYEKEQLKTEKNETEVYYFEKCLSLCKSKGIQMILITVPMSDKQLLSYSNYDASKLIFEEYAEEYGCSYYDFNLLKTKMADYPSDTAFFDDRHLSSVGADTFTNALADILYKASVGEDISDLFFGSYAEANEYAYQRIVS